MRGLCDRYPSLRQGASDWSSLRSVLRARVKTRGLELKVLLRPWPDRGAVQRIGNVLVVTIDSRQSTSDRVYALAHEAGHILFGHYAMDEGVWTLVDGRDGGGEYKNAWEDEADYFASFACRSRCMPAEWIIGGQKELDL